MILHSDSDAACIVEPNARSRAGGYYYLGTRDHTLFNGAIHVLARILKNVIASAMEAKIGALYKNAKLIIKYQKTLEEMGHPQPPTVVRTDNKTACGIVHDTMKQKRSKEIDMRYHWLKDRVNNHKLLDIRWAPGILNLGDYPSKHHPPSHHRKVRQIFLYKGQESHYITRVC